MYNKNPKSNKSPLTKRLCGYGIILLAVLSITMTVLGLKDIISKEIINTINCLSSLLSCGLLSRLVKHKSRLLLYFLVGCTSICFVCFLIVAAVTYLN